MFRLWLFAIPLNSNGVEFSGIKLRCLFRYLLHFLEDLTELRIHGVGEELEGLAVLEVLTILCWL